MRLSFSISLHVKDKRVLVKIQEAVQAGNICLKGSEAVQWRVNNKQGIVKLIDFLQNYPLITQKRADFILFKKVFFIIQNNEHLTVKGLK